VLVSSGERTRVRPIQLISDQKTLERAAKEGKSPEEELLKGLSRTAPVKSRLKKGEPPSKPKYVR
jgi:hypothetical protein